MRPVDRGADPGPFTDYRQAAPFLMQRLGDYCSYCERQIETNIAVEHIRPKDPVPGLALTWTNFLLGCNNCNSCKGDTNVNLPDYVWPDTENTMRAFQYRAGGFVDPHPALVPPLDAKALATIRLLGLDKFPGNAGREPTESDRRWLRREQIWKMATDYRAKLAANNAPDFRQAIVDLALSRGAFSIWWTVFDGDADMRRRLREAFVGTDNPCFDPATEGLLPRAGGQL